jgi:uncharacterized membrane protein
MTTPVPQPSGFDMNRPTVVALLYLVSFITGFTALIGVILAYVWKGELFLDWEASHFRWHIRSFWIGALYSLVSTLFVFILIGYLMYAAVAVWFAVRTVKALMAAQRRAPMPNVESWLF